MMVNKETYNSKFLFFGLILYSVIFYTQIGSRLPFLAPFRVEFMVGAVILAVIFFDVVSGKIRLNENKVNYAAIIFFAICAVSVLFAYVKSRALAEYISLLKFFSIYLMIISCIGIEKRLKIFFYIYLSMISLLFVEPFLLSLNGEGFRFNNHMMRLYGVTGFFAHPNQLGGITSANLPFFYYMFLFNKNMTLKIVLLLLIAIAIYVVMLTQSRTAFVGVIVFAFFVWWSSKHKMFFVLVLLILSAIGWQVAPEETKGRFSTLGKMIEVAGSEEGAYAGNKELGSLGSRMLLLKRSLIVFSEKPFIGVGIGCYASVSGQRWNSWFPTHNLYTQALSEIGLIGTLSFGYVLFCIIKNITKAIKIMEKNEDRQFVFYLVSSLYMFLLIRLIIGFFGHDLYRNWWWVAAGFSVVSLRILERKYNHGNVLVSRDSHN
jgi:O-antigen ligase